MNGDSVTTFVQTQLGGGVPALSISPETLLIMFAILKFVLLSATIFFIGHIAYLIYKIGEVKGSASLYAEALGRKKAAPIRSDVFITGWDAIMRRMSTMQEAEYKLAIIEADKLFDELLKGMGYKGKDMGERLQQITPERLSNISAIWKSHKVRNFISHDTQYHLTFSEAQWVIKNYEDAFIEMRALPSRRTT